MVGPGSTPCLILCNNYFLQPSSCSITVFDKSYIVIQRSWFLLQRKLCLEDPSSCLSATVYVMSSSIPNSKFKKFFKLDISAITFSVSCDSTMADQKLSEPALKREQLDEFVVCSVIHIHSDFFFFTMIFSSVVPNFLSLGFFLFDVLDTK